MNWAGGAKNSGTSQPLPSLAPVVTKLPINLVKITHRIAPRNAPPQLEVGGLPVAGAIFFRRKGHTASAPFHRNGEERSMFKHVQYKFSATKAKGRGKPDTCHQQDQPQVPTIHIKKLKVSKHEQKQKALPHCSQKSQLTVPLLIFFTKALLPKGS